MQLCSGSVTILIRSLYDKRYGTRLSWSEMHRQHTSLFALILVGGTVAWFYCCWS